MSETKFVNGLFVNKPHENAPQFVICGIAINKAKFLADIDSYELDEKGFFKMQVLEAKAGDKYFAKIDTWRPSGGSSPAPVVDDSESLPF